MLATSLHLLYVHTAIPLAHLLEDRMHYGQSLKYHIGQHWSGTGAKKDGVLDRPPFTLYVQKSAF